jgi:ATP-dependent DNA ligase
MIQVSREPRKENRMTPRTWQIKSSSSSSVYNLALGDDGRLSCECLGWRTKRGAKPRACKHTNQVADELRAQGLFVEQRDDGQYVHEVGDVELSAQLARSAAAVQEARVTVHEAKTVLQQVETTLVTYHAPMLAVEKPDARSIGDYRPSEWSMEQKFDGQRVTVRVQDGVLVGAWSRGSNERVGNHRNLPLHVQKALSALPDGYYDGELVVPGGRSTDVAALVNRSRLVLVLFDVLELLGVDLKDETYVVRRAALETVKAVLADEAVIVASNGEPSQEMYDAIVEAGGGVMLKRRDSRYKPGIRAEEWVKVKARREAVFELVSFEAGKLGPYAVMKLRHIDTGLECTTKTLNNDWLRRAERGDFPAGTLFEVEFQSMSATGFRHPMIKRQVANDQ